MKTLKNYWLQWESTHAEQLLFFTEKFVKYFICSIQQLMALLVQTSSWTLFFTYSFLKVTLVKPKLFRHIEPGHIELIENQHHGRLPWC